MIKLSLVGIGSGNPDHVTRQAIKTLQSADLILLPRKGDDKTELADLRRDIVAELQAPTPKVVEFDYPVRDAKSPKYLDGVNQWHDALAAIWGQLIAAHGDEDSHVALMVWGDPSLYDSTLRIADRLKAQGLAINVSVVPGITSLQMLTAAHAIPLNDLGAAVQITTGRQLRDHGWPNGVNTLAIMLDGACAFQQVDPQNTEIYWGAYVGMPQQILIAGPLSDVTEKIVKARANARAQQGWIMDIYVLRRVTSAGC